MEAPLKTYEQVAQALRAYGVDCIFGLMGDANMYYLSEFQRAGGRLVPVVHEASAVSMAAAYARASGRLGVASVTHGPGFTNTLTSLVDSDRSGVEVMLLTGDPPSEPTHVQRLDLAAVCSSLGIAHDRVHSVATLHRDLDRAMRTVAARTRPVVVNLPLEVCLMDAVEQPPVRVPARPQPRLAGDLDEALGVIATSTRPVLLAGRGAVDAGARDALVALAERTGAALATTVLAKDLFAGHPRNLGVFGSLAHETASSVIAESDCLIAFGASLNRYTTMARELTADKRVVQVDDDATRLGWYVPVDEGVAGDAALVATAMDSALTAGDHAPVAGWARRVAAAIAEAEPAREFVDRSTPDTIDIRTAAIRLDEVLPPNRCLVSDVGRFVAGAWRYLHVGDPRDFDVMVGFGSIGLGLAGAVGAAVARPDRLTVALVGDGGFMMHVGELSTAVREGLPLVVVVFNDGAYGAEHHKLKARGIDADYSLNHWPDFVPLARAMGADATVVRTVEDLDAIGGALSRPDRPHLLDVRLDPELNIPY